MKYFKSVLVFFVLSNILFFLCISLNKLTINENCVEDAQTKPSDWLFAQRAFPYESVRPESYSEALRQAQNLRNTTFSLRNSSSWTLAGPTNTGGRITSLAIHPSDAQTIYVGAAAGGIFKTTNSGASWTPIFDDNSSLSIGDVAIAPSNKNILYVGTGEANGGGGSVNFDGLGVFKTINGGNTWQNVGLQNVGSIGKVAIDPENPDRVFIAAMGSLYNKNPERGIYRTTNGGTTWRKVFYLTDSTGCIDIAIHPQNPNIILAAMWERIRRPNSRNYGGASCGIYRSMDGGDTWVQMENGLPATHIGRIGIAISPADPSVFYSIFADEIGFFKGIYKSTDTGNSWTQMDGNNNLSFMYSSFGWWFGKIVADPADVNTVYALGVDTYKSTDGGQNWRNISAAIHVDQHALWVNPTNTDQLYAGNDGGFYMSDNGAATWNNPNNLPITQFYTSEIDNMHPERLYGGSQDNGTWRTLTGEKDQWQYLYGGDGFVCLVDPNDNNFMYASFQNGNFVRSVDGGKNFDYGVAGISPSDPKNWKTPVVLAPDNSSTLYYGSNRLYRSIDRAATWKVISPNLTTGAAGSTLAFGTITAIAVSPVNPQIIYCGADDGNVWVTSNGGGTWVKINNGLPMRWVTAIAADPFDENTAYITFSGYKWWDYQPHVMKTVNKGQLWMDISANLPQAPVNDFIADPSLSNTFYIGSDFGVYTSTDGGGSWSVLGKGLPLVSVMDLTIHKGSRTLVAATHGRSMYRFELPSLAPQYAINGSIRREQGDTIAAQIFLYRDALVQTLNSSLFSFSNLPQLQNYKLVPYRNDNPLRGVTTFDIALISRHILGIEPLSTPYKIIAADANHDGEVDASDMLIIRKLILRQIDTFPNNTSWRFVPKNHVFTNLDNPFNPVFSESLTFNGLNKNITNADFYAIKTGDVNNSATGFMTTPIEVRDADKLLKINVLDRILQKDKTYTIPLVIDHFEQLAAVQFALNWDNTQVDVIAFDKGNILKNDDFHYAVFKEKGTVAFSWNSKTMKNPIDEKMTLNLTMRPKNTVRLSQVLTQNNAHTEGVAYSPNGNAFPLTLAFEAEKQKQYRLYPNYPNPFSQATTVAFDLPEHSPIRLTFSDLSGRILEDLKGSYPKGHHQIIYTVKNAATTPGVLICRLEVDGQVKTQMMIFQK